MSSILRLSATETVTALDQIDPLDLVAQQLILRATPGHDGASAATGRLTRRDGTDSVLLEDGETRCLLPAETLRLLRVATLTALAARQLLPSGVVTAAVLGTGAGVQTQLAVLARHVTGISHVAVCDTAAKVDIEPWVLDQLHLAGISLLTTMAVDEAVLGANLVVVAGPAGSELELPQLARGALVINATDTRLRPDLVAGVDQVYVDDIELVDAHDTHYTRPVTGLAGGSRRARQWPRPVVADLGQVLTGGHAGRAHVDAILLVELFSVDTLDASFALGLHWAAVRMGLGKQNPPD